VKDAVVVLKNPKLEGDKLSFTVQTLEAAIVCWGCSPFSIPRRNVRGRCKGCIWGGRLCCAYYRSYPSPSGLRLLPYPPCD
jgi:hypothetical protein